MWYPNLCFSSCFRTIWVGVSQWIRSFAAGEHRLVAAVHFCNATISWLACCCNWGRVDSFQRSQMSNKQWISICRLGEDIWSIAEDIGIVAVCSIWSSVSLITIWWCKVCHRQQSSYPDCNFHNWSAVIVCRAQSGLISGVDSGCCMSPCRHCSIPYSDRTNSIQPASFCLMQAHGCGVVWFCKIANIPDAISPTGCCHIFASFSGIAET